MSPSTAAARVGRPRSAPSKSADLDPREQILDAAAALFAERGYAGTSTRAIAERVGVRQASLYYHFAGKDDILLELLETSVRPSLAFVDELVGHPDPVAALYALAVIDVGTLRATAHNVGTLYLSHEVQQPRFDGFREQRNQLQAAYVVLAAAVGSAGADSLSAGFLGAACMQLVEMVIIARRDGEPGPDLAASVALACLRVVGLSAERVREGSRRGEELLGALA